ncbi:Retrovirus-related Pol polyprotein from transposon TNT 1-94 [Sesamum angolense]|uniref:Retrovirus-related Pol polyprotein from transposon TNT 1-94 n=1 Tax=Sesamum angolense TaxID=2727404 RepID=A0AAE1XI64_9LAMI|nr:Retrovirus-related Pol polyprotein from transposon TNT 1-94 [Sesamum angolense]
MKSKMDSTGSNQVWTLIDTPKGVKPVGCKWVYKHKLGADGEVTAFKARLMTKENTQRLRVNFEETYSPIAMAKSIWILLAIATWSIYGLKETSRSWNTRFDEVIQGYDIIKNEFDPCIYKKISRNSVAYLVLYVNDILLIGNNVKMLGEIKAWLSTQLFVKDMGEASYILGIKIYKDRFRKMLESTQSSYIEKVLKRFKMENSKKGFLPTRHGIRPDVTYALSMTSRYQACAGETHWSAVKTVLKYLKMTKDMFLIYGGGELILEGYSNTSFQSDDDDAKSQLGFVVKVNGGVVAWKSSKQATTADSTTIAEYIATSKVAKEVVWMKKYIQESGVVPSIVEPIAIFFYNNGVIAQEKKPTSHHRSKYILRRYHLLRDMVSRGTLEWTESAQ